MKNTKASWVGSWITGPGAQVSQEPEFSLAEMFSGQVLDQEPVEDRLHPVLYLKKVFRMDQGIASARLTITCQGIYQAYLNGQKVTEAIFTPDYTDYHHCLMY